MIISIIALLLIALLINIGIIISAIQITLMFEEYRRNKEWLNHKDRQWTEMGPGLYRMRDSYVSEVKVEVKDE